MHIDKKMGWVLLINWVVLVGLYSLGRIQEGLPIILIPDELDPYWYQGYPFLLATAISSIYAFFRLHFSVPKIIVAQVLMILSLVLLVILAPMRIGL